MDPLPAFAGNTVSGGRLNVYKSLAAAGSAAGSAGSQTPATTGSLFGDTPIGSRSAVDGTEAEEGEPLVA